MRKSPGLVLPDGVLLPEVLLHDSWTLLLVPHLEPRNLGDWQTSRTFPSSASQRWSLTANRPQVFSPEGLHSDLVHLLPVDVLQDVQSPLWILPLKRAFVDLVSDPHLEIRRPSFVDVPGWFFWRWTPPSLDFQLLLQVPPPSLDRLVLKLLKHKRLKLLNRHRAPPCWFISRLLFKSGDFGGDFIRFFLRETSVVPLFRVHALDLGDKSQGVIPSDHWTSRPLPAFDFSQSWVFHRTSCTGQCDGVSQARKSSERNYRFHRTFR